MTTPTTLNQIVIGVAQAFAPLKSYFTDIDRFSVFMKSLGWDVTEIPTAISDLNSSINDTISKLNTIIEAEEPSIGDYLTLLNSVEKTVKLTT